MLTQKHPWVEKCGIIQRMHMCHLGVEASETTTTVWMERQLQDVSLWSASQEATASHHAWLLGRILYLMCLCAFRGIYLGDAKASNWGCCVSNGKFVELSFIDLGGVTEKKQIKPRSQEFHNEVEKLVYSFPRAPRDLKTDIMEWFHSETAAKNRVRPAWDAFYQLIDGFKKERLQPFTCLAVDDLANVPNVAAELNLAAKHLTSFPERDQLAAQFTVITSVHASMMYCI